MGSSALLLTREALVLTTKGPCSAGALEAGVEVLGLHTGAHRWAPVSAIEPIAEAMPARRITTVAGVAVLVEDVKVEASRGPTRVADLADGDSLELVHPAELPMIDCSPSALGGHGSLTAVIPRENGCADAIEEALDDLIARAGLVGEKLTGGRWMAVRVGRSRDVDWTWNEEAELALALHAWDAENGKVREARVRLQDAKGRRLALGALMASRQGYQARPVPVFSPCEIRITRSDTPWPAHSPITSSTVCMTEATRVHFKADRWSIVADQMIVRPQRH